MIKVLKVVLFSAVLVNLPVAAADKLVLDLDLDADLLSLTHHVDNFLFTPTLNFSLHVAGNLSDNIKVDALKNHLVASSLVRINGEIAGVATEQELLVFDEATGRKYAESAWLITLNYPGASGFIAVKQQEEAGPAFGLVSKVMENPEGDWEDKDQRFLSTSDSPTVQLATGDLAGYQGGRFEEYNSVNPTDFKRYQRFRPKIQFVIYPGK